MLVSFSVQNYRSFASKQSISLVAGTGAKRQKRFSFPSNNSFAPNLLNSICIFGPNGAGKSAFIRAINFYKKFIVSSAKDGQEGEEIDVSSFKFDQDWKGQPSEFEAVFIHEGALYQYGFAVDETRVWSEWLFSRPNTSDTKIRTLFQREYDVKKEDYVWNISKAYVKGEKELWKKSTRDNALFLSTAIQLKAETFKEPFDWVQKSLQVIEGPERLSPIFTAHQCIEEGWKDRVVDFLRSVDVGIMDIEIDTKEFDSKDLPTDMLTESMREEIKKKLTGKKTFQIKSYHSGADGKLVPLDFSDESDGTRVIFSLAGPWLDILEKGYTLVIDELHNSLHPHALKFLVGLFHNPAINTKNAQLIFTSHETSVMAKGFMHQDQVWLVEKNGPNGSKLIPLSDYKVRDISAFQKAYLDGRYGAVPKLKELVDGKS